MLVLVVLFPMETMRWSDTRCCCCWLDLLVLAPRMLWAVEDSKWPSPGFLLVCVFRVD